MKNKLLRGAVALSLAGIICKVIGVLYRIPLANLLGTAGMSAYQMAFPVYTLLLVVSSAGMPAAVSGLVAARVAAKDMPGARQVLYAAVVSLLTVGIVGSIALFALSGALADFLMMPSAKWSFAAISPSLLFVALIAAIRGYFQGLHKMTPTAVSQIAEQAAKLVFSLALAYKLAPYGSDIAAAGALIGVSISELIALIIIFIMYLNESRKNKITGKAHISTKAAMVSLWRIALPITLGACVMPIVGAIDSAMIMHLMTASGSDVVAAAHSYGLLTGYVQPVAGMPCVFSLALCTGLVPAVSAAGGKKEKIAHQTGMSLKLGLFFSVPCAAALFLMGGDILSFLFGSLSQSDVQMGAALMRIAAIGVILLALVQICTGVMQGMGRPLLPAVFLCMGAGVKIAAGRLLIPRLGAGGAEAATVLCFALTAFLDLFYVVRLSGVELSVKDVLMPAAGSMAAALAAWLLKSAGVHVIIAMLCFIAVYFAVYKLIFGRGLKDILAQNRLY